MAAFSTALLDEIRTRADVVELVGQFVSLKRAGENWKGLCPFHTERTPSFTVNPKRGIFHCFGCGAGGDVFGFLMRMDRLAFPEAVRALAERTGVALPASGDAAREGESTLEPLRRAMARAAEFYSQCLWDAPGRGAREYLDQRGVDHEVARRFGLGYAPDGWNALVTRLAREAIGEDLLVQVGLARPRQTGAGCYDLFRGRLMFPIRDAQGRVVAFGGRALGREEPKYLNSPETPLYVKGQTLYALDQARAAMRAHGRALIVEGYLDCVIAHQYGFAETVAALGTAFTPAQLALLRRHVDLVVAVFDADAAGQRAATRLEDMLTDAADPQHLVWSVARTSGFERSGPFSIRVAILPSGHDPDSLLRAEGAPALLAAIDAARPLLSFALEKTLAEEDLETARGRAAVHARVARLLSKVSSAEEATSLSREAGRRLGVDATQLWIEAQQLQGARARRQRSEAEAPASRPGARPWPAPSLAERDLLVLLLTIEDARTELLGALDDADVSHPGLRAVLAALRQSPNGAPEALMAELTSDAERELLASLLVQESRASDSLGAIGELKKRYDIRRRKQRVRQVSQAIAEAQVVGEAFPPELEQELRSLQREAEAVRELACEPLSRPGPHAGR